MFAALKTFLLPCRVNANAGSRLTRSRSRWLLSGAKSSRRYAWKAVGFTVAVGCTSFSLAHIVNNRHHKSTLTSNITEGEHDLRSSRFQKDPLIQLVKLVWSNFSDVQKVTVGIIGVNLFIHLMWTNPLHRKFLVKWFLSCPSSGLVFPMLFCCFSHAEFLHIFMNMLLLWKIVRGVEESLTVEQFLATYCTSGVFGIMCSNLFKVCKGVTANSLGASASVFALLAIVGINKPNYRIGFDSVPQLSLSARTCLLLLLGYNIAGLLLRWQAIDYAAHIGGALFGCFLLCEAKLKDLVTKVKQNEEV